MEPQTQIRPELQRPGQKAQAPKPAPNQDTNEHRRNSFIDQKISRPKPNPLLAIHQYIMNNNHYLGLLSRLNNMAYDLSQHISNPTALTAELKNPAYKFMDSDEDRYITLFAKAVECGVSLHVLNALLATGSRGSTRNRDGQIKPNTHYPCIRNTSNATVDLPPFQYKAMKGIVTLTSNEVVFRVANEGTYDTHTSSNCAIVTLSVMMEDTLYTVMIQIKDGAWDFENCYRIQANESQIALSEYGILGDIEKEAINKIAITVN